MSKTREIAFFIKLNKLTIDELINLKKADENKNLGGNRLDIVVSMYIQISEEIEEYSQKFFKDMKEIKVDGYKGDWFL